MSKIRDIIAKTFRVTNRYNNDTPYRLSIKNNILRRKKAEYYTSKIPFIESKKITLSNAGRATGAVLSTNLLDSIAKYSDITGLPIKTAIGLATKESTLGNPTYNSYIYAAPTMQHINRGDSYNSQNLVSYWRYDNLTPYEQLINSVDDRIERGIIKESDRDKYLKWEENAADKQAVDYKKYNVGPYLQAAFNYYKDYPERYNPGQKNYNQMVDIVGNEVWGSPEIQNWYRRRLESAGKKSK